MVTSYWKSTISFMQSRSTASNLSEFIHCARRESRNKYMNSNRYFIHWLQQSILSFSTSHCHKINYTHILAINSFSLVKPYQMISLLYLVSHRKVIWAQRFTNDITEQIKADDVRIAKIIKSAEDTTVLQKAINNLTQILVRHKRTSSQYGKITAKSMVAFACTKRFCSDNTDTQTLKSLYYALVSSYLEYCCVVWLPFYGVHRRKIECIQKRMLERYKL